MKSARQKLEKLFSNKKHICVGLDTDIAKIPEHLKTESDPIFAFNKAIIDATYESAAAYKINLAFYEKDGEKGFEDLLKTVEYIPNEIPIIGDAKRGDIGNTSSMYAKSLFEYFKFDSTTLSPYMGYDSLSPFFEYQDKINFILALTSNKGAENFEKLKLASGKFLYQEVISKCNEWNKSSNLGVVFGATKAEELDLNGASLSNLYLLIPGVGAQGGSLEEITSILTKHSHRKFLINVSRSLIYKDSSKNFDKEAFKEIVSLNDTIQNIIND